MRRVVLLMLTSLTVACGGESTNNHPPSTSDAGQSDGSTGAMPASDGGAPDATTPGDLGSADAGMDVGADFGADTAPAADLDRDDDGVEDDDDAFPDDPAEWLDSDGDGTGNAAQQDEDGDGTPDIDDAYPFDPGKATLTPFTHPLDGSFPNLGGDFPLALEFTSRGVLDQAQALFEVTAGTPLLLRVRGAGEAELTIGYETTTYPEPLDLIDSTQGERVFTWVAPVDGRVLFTLLAIDGGGSDARLIVERDDDIDGLSNDFETALGLRPAHPDPDDDGVADGREWRLSGAADIDGDGLAGWLDADQDGDGLRDGTEGLGDPDGDGTANLLDDDSDGNGTLDRDEPGVQNPEPLDFDADGAPDWRDLDDDNDGLLDVNDANIRMFDTPTRGFTQTIPILFAEAHGLFGPADDVAVPDAVRIGEPLVIQGSGFAGSPTVIARYDDGTTLNASVANATATTMQVTLDRAGTARVSVLQSGAITEERLIDILEPDAPVLFPVDGNTAVESWRGLAFTGENLENVSHLVLDDGSQVAVFWDSADGELDLGSGSANFGASGIRPRASGKTGNRIFIRTLRRYGVRTAVPAAASFTEADLDVSARPDEVIDAAGFGGEWIVTASYDDPVVAVASVDAANGTDPVMMSSLFPAQLHDMNMLTTAVTWAMQVNGATTRLPVADYKLAYDDALLLPEVVALAAALETAATTSTDYLRSPPAALQTAFEAALGPVEGVVQARIPVVSPVRQLGIVTPGEQADVMVMQTKGSGNLTVENDTSLYLSAEVVDKSGRPLQPHVTSYADLRMLSPQRGPLLLFYASSGELSAPNYRSADIEVVTPGFASPQPTAPRAVDGQVMVLLRSGVDKVLLPVISAAIDANLNAGTIVQLLLVHNYDIIQDLRTAITSGSGKDALWVITNAFLRDLENLGPVTTGILKMAFGKSAVAAVAEKFAERLIPGLGQLDLILGAAGAVNTAIGVGKTLVDFSTTPGVLNWSVDFGLEITGAQPQMLERRHRSQNVCLQGVGFREGDGALSDLTFRDLGAQLGLQPTSVWGHEDGTEICARLRARDAARLVGPIEATITSRDGTEDDSATIGVGSTLELFSITEYQGATRATPRLHGAGFGRDASDLRVRFYDPPTNNVFATARVTHAQDSWLKFEMPVGIARDEPYDLVVVQGPVLADVESNILPIQVDYPPLRGDWEISAQFLIQNWTTCEWNEENVLATVDNRIVGGMAEPAYPVTLMTPFHALSAGNDLCNLGFNYLVAPGQAWDGLVVAQTHLLPLGCAYPGVDLWLRFGAHMRNNRIRVIESNHSQGCASYVKRMTLEFTPEDP